VLLQHRGNNQGARGEKDSVGGVQDPASLRHTQGTSKISFEASKIWWYWEESNEIRKRWREASTIRWHWLGVNKIRQRIPMACKI
jgi:hypothetical protein